MRIGLPVALITAVFVHGCVAPRDRGAQPQAEAPASRPVALPAPAPVPVPTPVEPGAAWADLPDTPGSWAYRADTNSSTADFLGGGAPLFSMTCTAARQIRLERAGAAGSQAALAVQTSYGVQRLSAAPFVSARPPFGASVAAEVPPSSPLLDQIAFSRGHFTVDVPGAPRLVLPAHPEVARIVENCRS